MRVARYFLRVYASFVSFSLSAIVRLSKKSIAKSAIGTTMAVPPNCFQDAVDKVTSGSSRFELVYTTHPAWPLPSETETSDSPVEISVLDSSFNPPTLAHDALASLDPSSSARLLLLSLRNSDKTLKPGDASPAQRLEMMVLLANELVAKGGGPVAVGTIDEPTFVGKSTVVLEHLGKYQPPFIITRVYEIN